jgi:hypothetical protein
MNDRVRSKTVLERKLAEHALEADGPAVENDFWAWAVIFTTAALTALCVAMLFCVRVG